MQLLMVPDIGDYQELPVIEVLVSAGDTVTLEQPLITLESDKATIDVPSNAGGKVIEMLLKAGDLVSAGSVIARIEAENDSPEAQEEPAPHAASNTSSTAAPVTSAAAPAPAPTPSRVQPAAPADSAPPPPAPAASPVRAGPAVRKLARELGVELAEVRRTGPGQRVVREDLLAHVKQRLSQPAQPAQASGAGELDLAPWPQIDFSKFGPIRRQAMERIKRISGRNLHRNWVRIPHVTNHDKADITDLEALRVSLNHEGREGDAKVTLLAFLVKACVALLKEFPHFNVSLDGDDIVQKDYYHIGFAADTPKGLVVPVIRDADRLSIRQIAEEMGRLASAARTGKLTPEQMQGGCISISSLGGIGGSHFTPIINAPEVAILGVGRAEMQPVWDGSGFQPRLILPLSLSWDHRAVDGADAGRLLAQLSRFLTDFRRVVV